MFYPRGRFSRPSSAAFCQFLPRCTERGGSPQVVQRQPLSPKSPRPLPSRRAESWSLPSLVIASTTKYHTCKKRVIPVIYHRNFFLDFLQNFRLRTRNQYCTQAIAWGSTILDGGSTILDGSSTIFCRFSPFFVDFHHFLSIFTIYALLSRFTFCRDFRTFFWPK